MFYQPVFLMATLLINTEALSEISRSSKKKGLKQKKKPHYICRCSVYSSYVIGELLYEILESH